VRPQRVTGHHGAAPSPGRRRHRATDFVWRRAAPTTRLWCFFRIISARRGWRFATSARDFQTAFGLVRSSQRECGGAAAAARPDRGVRSVRAGPRHRRGAALCAALLPAAEIVPIAVSIRSQQADWDRTRAHPGRARHRTDAGGCNRPISRTTAASGRGGGTTRRCSTSCRLPTPMRSRRWCSRGIRIRRGAQYVQMRLQQQRFGSRAVVIANANSQRYSDRVESETTKLCGADLSGRRSQAGRRAERSAGLAHLLLRRRRLVQPAPVAGAGRPAGRQPAARRDAGGAQRQLRARSRLPG